MPEISRFFGFVITMNYREHGPPHFHANTTVGKIDRLAERATHLVLEWWRLHRDELSENWDRARAGEPLRSVEPLE